jgi:hypothetical protein
MNPFEMPPSGSPVSVDSPSETSAAEPPSGRNRGRMALVAVVTAGLIGGGIVGVSALASADRPEVEDAASTPVATVPDDTPSDDTASEDTAPEDTPPGSDDEAPENSHVGGKIELNFGDGDPIVIDLDELDEDAVRQLTDCIGLPSLDFSLDRPVPPSVPNLRDLFDRFEKFELPDGVGDLNVLDGGTVTVTGPDGVSVVDLGENGSVTVTKNDDGVSIETKGDATVSELDDMFGDLGKLIEGELTGDLGGVFERIPGRGDLPDFEPLDADAVQACIDDAFGN